MSLFQSKKSISGKVVVITGASSGVGLATAIAFAKEDCKIVLAARGEEALKKALQQCQDLGATVVYKTTDTSNAKEVEELVNFTLKHFSQIDFWINNAGVMASGKFEEIPMEVSEQVIKTNLMGYMHSAYYVLPVFKKQEKGILINNVSIAGYMPAPFSAVYSATKYGIKGLMAGLQSEYSIYPEIHICNIYPQVQQSTGNMHSAKYSGLDFKIPPFAADPTDTAQLIVNLTKKPKNDNFPDASSYLLKSVHDFFPQIITNIAHIAMRVMMKMKHGEEDEGNILKPSGKPHQIYGETSLPVPSKSTKKIVTLGVVIGFGLYMMKKGGKK